MDRVDTALMLAMLCLMAGTLLVGFSRPLWWMLHKRSPDGSRYAPRHYEWLLRIPGALLLGAAVWVICLSVMGALPVQLTGTPPGPLGPGYPL